MDAIVAQGVFGIHDPVQAGLSCGSDTAHMSIFGYDPLKFYDGRGSFESMGAGLSMEAGEIAFKCNFSYKNESGVVERRRVDRTFPEWGVPLCDALNNMEIPGFPNHKVGCSWATEHRCGIKVSGPNLSSAITDTDPLKDDLPLLTARALEAGDTDAELTANLVNSLSDAITAALLTHPINVSRKEQGLTYTNMVTLRGASKRLSLPSFETQHGFKAFMIAPTAIIRGVGLTFDMVLDDSVTGMTGFYDSNLDGKCDRAASRFIENWQKNSDEKFGFVHVKATDDAGHDKDRPMKVEQIEKADRAITRFVTAIGDYLKQTGSKNDIVLCVTGDHTTPVKYGDHTFEPVPFAIGRVSKIFETL